MEGVIARKFLFFLPNTSVPAMTPLECARGYPLAGPIVNAHAVDAGFRLTLSELRFQLPVLQGVRSLGLSAFVQLPNETREGCD
jgi:hypothetical protein